MLERPGRYRYCPWIHAPFLMTHIRAAVVLKSHMHLTDSSFWALHCRICVTSALISFRAHVQTLWYCLCGKMT